MVGGGAITLFAGMMVECCTAEGAHPVDAIEPTGFPGDTGKDVVSGTSGTAACIVRDEYCGWVGGKANSAGASCYESDLAASRIWVTEKQL